MATQVLDRHRDVFDEVKRTRGVENYYAVTYRPGGRTQSFLGQRYVPLSHLYMLVQMTGRHAQRPRQLTTSLEIFKAWLDPAGKKVSWRPTEFSKDVSRPPRDDREGRVPPWVLDLHHDLEQVYSGLELVQSRLHAAACCLDSSTVPRFPPVFLQMAVGLPPAQDTPAMEARIAAHSQMSVQYLRSLPAAERALLVAAEWPSCFRRAGEEDLPDDGHAWLPVQFAGALASRASATTTVADMGDLMGGERPNPAASLHYAGPNPAPAVCQELGLDLQQRETWCKDAILDPLERKLRHALGPAGLYASQGTIFGLLDAGEQIELSPEQVLHMEELGDLAAAARQAKEAAEGNPEDAEAVASYERYCRGFRKARDARLLAIRQGLPRWLRECVTEDAALEAAWHPDQPLLAAGLPQIQVCRIERRDGDAALRFSLQETDGVHEADLTSQWGYA